MTDLERELRIGLGLPVEEEKQQNPPAGDLEEINKIRRVIGLPEIEIKKPVKDYAPQLDEIRQELDEVRRTVGLPNKNI